MKDLIGKSLKFAEDMRLQCLEGFNQGHINELDLLNSICVYQDACLDAILAIIAGHIQCQEDLDDHLVSVVRDTFPEFELRYHPKLRLVKS